MAHTNHELRRAIADDPHAAFTNRSFPLGARIRALEWAEPSPEIYDALANEAQDIIAGRELYMGMSMGCEARVESLESTLRTLRVLLDGSGVELSRVVLNGGFTHVFPPGEDESHAAERSCPCVPRQVSNEYLTAWQHHRILSQ